MTYNAFVCRHDRTFIDAVTQIGAKQKFITPHCPWQNGKVERFKPTLQTKWAYCHVFTSNQHRRDSTPTTLNATTPHQQPPARPSVTNLMTGYA
ncbi:integrase core domain-containing protein [Schaalia hyovaginalis]|uniref:integrase core domain-containing protein n=1 Tax=Schaalia hyovaginalis TaxID=29316 RepID=UPI0038B3C5E2